MIAGFEIVLLNANGHELARVDIGKEYPSFETIEDTIKIVNCKCRARVEKYYELEGEANAI